ncbi:MAG: hypothetical protein AAFQ80_19265 [Cyanobacteria bacterium J06621_8]
MKLNNKRFTKVSNQEVDSRQHHLNSPTTPWWRSWQVILAGTLGASLISVPIVLDYSVSRVIHFMVDDVSLSAAEQKQSLRIEHCQASFQNYKEGDFQVQVVFADQPEMLREKKVTNVLMLGNCNDVIATGITVGQQRGTSLILVLEYIDDLIKSYRFKGSSEPIVVTISIDEAEPGPGQPLMDRNGLLRVKSLLESIAQENGVVTIIGPTQELQRDLQKQSIELTNTKICTSNDVTDCVKSSFRSARQLAN